MSSSKSKLSKLLICHIIGLELTNAIGFICTMASLYWYLELGQGLLQKTYHLLNLNKPTCADLEPFQGLPSEMEDWIFKMNTMNLIMSVVFTLTGLLTDSMLVRFLYHLIKIKRSFPIRYGVADRYGSLRFSRSLVSLLSYLLSWSLARQV